ncbi:hypothetical protein VHEMI04276 [[Torrubiella] hemipterigena]|uniref:Uncharacterized protein n=1 Tax=[Torrubiella] hemipterigena TaxID=1531966 RepID=A0A0A1T0S8_9HYPO|nr:hypothetical protein VHEMI04276 [[Torrubiella] hemipterigena]
MGRRLDIVYPGWSGRYMDVIDSHTSEILYKYEKKGIFKQSIIITRPSEKGSSSEHTIAKVSISSKIAIDIEGGNAAMKKPSNFSSNYEFVTDALSGTWTKPGWLSSRMELVSTTGVLASLERAWSFFQEGTLEILGNPSQRQLDMIVVTALVMMEKQDSDRKDASQDSWAAHAAPDAAAASVPTF